MIILTGQPKSTNTLYRSVCRGSNPCVYMTEDGKTMKEQYQWEARSQWHSEPFQGDIEVDIKLFHGDKRIRDIDNYNKILLDALTGILWYDDKQIQKMTITKLYDKENPRIEINTFLYDKQK